MTGAALAVKLRAYAHYTRSREWAKELRSLPGLLVVTPDPSQEQRIQRLAWTCAEAGLMIRPTTVIRLEQQGPLAPIWLTMLPNQPTHFTSLCWIPSTLRHGEGLLTCLASHTEEAGLGDFLPHEHCCKLTEMV